MATFSISKTTIVLLSIVQILTSCHSHNTKDNIRDSSNCTVCKAPSRTTALKTSLTLDSNIVNGIDSGKVVLLQDGTFEMGSNSFPDAKPVHKITLASFYIDEHEVTNDQFAKFVAATNYKTVAEHPLNQNDYPDVPKDKPVSGSGVFTPPNHPVDLNNPMAWWTYVAGADWRHPEGPNSDITGKGNHPVIQVCYEDCLAYAKWAGKRLPTEAEWEFAAKGGHPYPVYYWGTEKTPSGKYMANNFQGKFPYDNTKADGYISVAPIKQYPANAYGLYDMEGNV